MAVVYLYRASIFAYLSLISAWSKVPPALLNSAEHDKDPRIVNLTTGTRPGEGPVERSSDRIIFSRREACPEISLSFPGFKSLSFLAGTPLVTLGKCID